MVGAVRELQGPERTLQRRYRSEGLHCVGTRRLISCMGFKLGQKTVAAGTRETPTSLVLCHGHAWKPFGESE